MNTNDAENDYREHVFVNLSKIGSFMVDNTEFIIAILTLPDSDWESIPSFHILRKDDAQNAYKNFDFELSLEKLIVNEEWFLLKKKDLFAIHPIDERTTADWDSHISLLEALKTALSHPYTTVGHIKFIDLLDNIIFAWNTEKDQKAVMQGRNPLYEFLLSKDFHIHPTFQKYFDYWIEKN